MPDVNALIESTLRLAQHTIGHKERCHIGTRQLPNSCHLGKQTVTGHPQSAAQRCSSQISTQIAVPNHGQNQYDGEDWLTIDIIDDGVGIPESQQHIIFEPFFTTKPEEGTGLGLSICQRILTSCGGHIQLLNSTENGSHFHIKLPVAVTSPVSEASIGSPAPEDKRLLVIDDNPQILELLKELLLPNTVDCRSTIQDAHDALDESKYDIILCDLIMPNEDGRTLYHQLKANGTLDNYHFAFITGGGVDGPTQRFLEDAKVPVISQTLSDSAAQNALGL